MKLVCAALAAELHIAKQLRSWKDLCFLATGMWNYKTIYTLTQYLSHHNDITEIIFVGICGRTEHYQGIIQIANIINAHTHKEIIIPISKKIAPLVTIISSEIPIHDRSLMQGKHYVDMESRGVAVVATQLKIPTTILRIPVDEIGSISCQTMDYKKALEQMKWQLSLIQI